MLRDTLYKKRLFKVEIWRKQIIQLFVWCFFFENFQEHIRISAHQCLKLEYLPILEDFNILTFHEFFDHRKRSLGMTVSNFHFFPSHWKSKRKKMLKCLRDGGAISCMRARSFRFFRESRATQEQTMHECLFHWNGATISVGQSKMLSYFRFLKPSIHLRSLNPEMSIIKVRLQKSLI